MKKNDRDIQYFDLKLFRKTKAAGLTNAELSFHLDLPAFFNDVKAHIEQTDRIYSRSGVSFYISDMEVGANHVSILVNSVDKEKHNPVAVNITSISLPESRKELPLSSNWGLEASCHIVIKLDGSPEDGLLCLVEKTEGMPFSKLYRILNRVFRETCFSKNSTQDYTMAHPEGTDRKINWYAYGIGLAHPSDDFLAQIETNKLKGVSLVGKPSRIRGHDSRKHLPIEEVEFKIIHNARGLPGSRKNWFQRVRGTATATEMDEVKIKFEDDSGRTKTAKMDPKTGSLMNESKLVKSVLISDIEGTDSSSVQSLNTSLVGEMIKL